MEFVRYGSLKPQYHEIVDNENFHTPPVAYGFYAFPKGFSESFLLGGIGSGNIKNGRWKFVRDDNGKKLYVKKKDFYIDEYDDKTYNYLIAEPYKTILSKQNLTHNDVKLYKEDENGVNDSYVDKEEYAYVVIQNKPKYFKYNGLIWHHLDYYGNVWFCKPGDIIKRIGSSVLTDMKIYEKCLKKYLYQKRYKQAISYSKKDSISITNINGIPLSHIDKDEFEVYIEKV